MRMFISLCVQSPRIACFFNIRLVVSSIMLRDTFRCGQRSRTTTSARILTHELIDV